LQDGAIGGDDVVHRILEWAMTGCGEPPRGGRHDILALLNSQRGHDEALVRLVTVTAARLGIALPSGTVVGRDCLQLAAAIAVYDNGKLSTGLLRTMPVVEVIDLDKRADLVARHGLVRAFVDWGPDSPTKDAIVQRSPLTQVLTRAPRSGAQAAETAAVDLALDPDWKHIVRHSLASPSADACTQRFRGRVIAQLANELGRAGRTEVVAIYEDAMVHYGDEIQAHTLAALRTLRQLDVDTPKYAHEIANAWAHWWEPFAKIVEREPARVHALRSIHQQDYRAGLDLQREYLRLGGGNQ